MPLGQKDQRGLLPGTPNYAQKQRDDQVQNLAKLEAPFLKQIDANWDKVLNLRFASKPGKINPAGLPLNLDAETELQSYKKLYELRLEEISGYLTLTQDPDKTKEVAQKYLVKYVADATWQLPKEGEATKEELRQAVIEAGSKDPVIQLHLAMQVASDQGPDIADKQRDALQTLKKIYPALHDGKYNRYLVFQARYFIWELTPPHAVKERMDLNLQVLSAWADWLQAASEKPEHFGSVWGRIKGFLQKADIEQTRRIYEVVLNRPGIDPYFVHMIGAKYHHLQGWEYRGSGFANKVTKEGWENLAEHQKLTMRHAMHAWLLQPKISGAPELMMSYALTNSDMGTSEEWFLRTISLNYDTFTPFDRLEWSLRPRWGGSIEALLTFARACLLTPRFDTAVPPHGLELLIRVQEQEMPPGKSIFADSAVHTTLVQYLEAMDKAVAEASSGTVIPASYPQNRSALGALFTLAGDLPRARQAMGPAANEVSSIYHRRLQLRGDYALGRAMAAIPDLEEPLKRIDQTMHKGVDLESRPEDFDSVLADLKLVRQAFAMPEGNAPPSAEDSATATNEPGAGEKMWVRWYVHHAEAAIARMKEFATGELVNLTVDDRLLGWDTGGDWKAAPPDAVEITGTNPRPAYQLIPLARFIPPYDVRVIVKEIVPENPVPVEQNGRKLSMGYTAVNVGIALGSPDAASYVKAQSGMRQFGVYPIGAGAAIWKPYQEETPPHKAVPNHGQYSVRVRVWKHGRYSFHVNDIQVEDATDPKFVPGGDILFGSAINRNVPATVKLSQMSIRKISYDPPPVSDSDHAGLETYARLALKSDSKDAAAWLALGRSLTRQQKYHEALEAFQSMEKLQPYISVYDQDFLFERATCHSQIGDFAKALEEYNLINRGAIPPNEARSDLISQDTARILSIAPDETLRDGRRALGIITAINAHNEFAKWKDLWILAAAHAEVGEFDAAAKRIREAHVLAPNEQKAFLKELEKLFDQKQPYRFQSPPKAGAVTPTK